MKILKHIYSKFTIITLVVVFFSCSDHDTQKKETLVEATSLLTRTAGELKTFISASSIDLDPSLLEYDVEIFKVKYKTTYKGEEIIASGLVVLPTTKDPVGMVSFQHGTIVAQEDAPTALPINSTELILYAALSSSGFIGVYPDFIGFGESKQIFHPYYVEEPTADAVIDNLKAARDWAGKKGVSFDKKLFLAGYSQGGYATMAAHKSIETNGLSDFNLIASFPASGGYDIKGMQDYFFHQSNYDQPHYIAYVAMSYQSYYGWPSVISDFFKEPYASSIPTLFNGTKTPSEINAQLTNNIPDLIKSDLLQNIDTDAKYDYLVKAFEENSLLDWTPKTKMYMYHGDADTTVPYENSVNTYNKFITNGASAETIEFITLQGADHGTGIVPYIEDIIPKMFDLK
jgi:pimeloyl-ACP methyl ester carboxylesterase